MNENVIGYNAYLYFGIGNYSVNNYLVRLDVSTIKPMVNPVEEQLMTPEILWRPQYDWSIWAQPLIKDDVVYVHTLTGNDEPVEIAGINMNTKALEFYQLTGVKDGIGFDKGLMSKSLVIHEGVLYFTSTSISAWNLKTQEQIFQKVFLNTPPEKVYAADKSLEITFYNGKMYYTTLTGNLSGDDEYRNIFCIDAKTGNLVWSDIARPMRSESLGTNPIIAHGKMYVPQYIAGLRVYDPITGKLIGADPNFGGSGWGAIFCTVII